MMSEATVLHWITPAISDDELEALCARNPELCFERNAAGDVIVTPPAGSNGGRRNASLTEQLGVWNRREGKGVVFDSSAGFKLPDTSVRSPDASWIERSRWEALTPLQQEKWAPICPDVVFELVSRTGRKWEARERVASLLDNGAIVVVSIDPYAREIEVNGERKSWAPLEIRFPGCDEPFLFDPTEME